MATIEELKRKIEREKNYQLSHKEIESTQSEKKRLERQLSQLQAQRKHPTLTRFARGTKRFGIFAGKNIKGGFKNAQKAGANFQRNTKKKPLTSKDFDVDIGDIMNL